MAASDTPDSAVHEYQFGGDYVIASETNADAWICAPYTVDLTEAR